MRLEPAFQPITADHFLAMDFRTDRKYELVDGVIRMMTGGTRAHARVASNILIFLGNAFRGSGCRAYNSDAGIRIADTTVRYPGVSVMCGDAASRDTDELTHFTDPKVIFEVLSPSTRADDQGAKLDQYRGLSSLDTIVLVDPQSEMIRTIQRLGPSSWRDEIFAQPHDIDLPAIGILLPHAEIFVRD